MDGGLGPEDRERAEPAWPAEFDEGPDDGLREIELALYGDFRQLVEARTKGTSRPKRLRRVSGARRRRRMVCPKIRW